MLRDVMAGLKQWAMANAHEHVYFSDSPACSLCNAQGTRWIDAWHDGQPIDGPAP